MRKLWILLTSLFILVQIANAAMRDPTQPADINNVVQSTSQGGLVVSSIVYSKYRKHAVVNGEAVGIGDKIGDVEIIDINPESVRFKNAEGEFDVPLLALEVKTFRNKKE